MHFQKIWDQALVSGKRRTHDAPFNSVSLILKADLPLSTRIAQT
jgi:hypothetical protein